MFAAKLFGVRVALGIGVCRGVVVAVAMAALLGHELAGKPVHAAASGQQPLSAQAAPSKQLDPASAGAESYGKHCAICHGDQREGILPSFPPLLGIQRQLKDAQIVTLIRAGKGRMPGFPKLKAEEVTALVHYLTAADISVAAAGPDRSSAPEHPSSLAEAGKPLFQQNCAFCHGRDTMGGETGPDLTQSKLALADVNGDKISEVVREGRPEKKMPAFNFSSQELLSLAAFIHAQQAIAATQKGKRRGVEAADLQTGNALQGKEYFNGNCARCHSPSGDLKGIASRYEGLRLEQQMLSAPGARSKVTVTLPSGEKVTGVLAYLDEFTVGLGDQHGQYRSWSTDRVKFEVISPAEAHVELFSKYTDDDVHNLMAYLQTLR